MDYLRERYKGIRLLADDNPWLVELEYEHADQYERLMEAERILEEALERAQQAGVREREALDKVERQRAAIKKIQASRLHAQKRLDRQQQCIAELVGEMVRHGQKGSAAAILDEFEIYL